VFSRHEPISNEDNCITSTSPPPGQNLKPGPPEFEEGIFGESSYRIGY
jgi:hypothetical protein